MVTVSQFVAGCLVTWEKQTELRQFKCWLDCDSLTTLQFPPECVLQFLNNFSFYSVLSNSIYGAPGCVFI